VTLVGRAWSPLRHALVLVAVGCGWLGSPGTPVVLQQTVDFHPTVAHPLWPEAKGPIVRIDAAHHNYHTAELRFTPFAELLRADGFRVESHRAAFDAGALAGVGVLVVANALAERNVADWDPPHPSAFSPAEIDAVAAYVRSGGALLLVADHMPFPGAAADLASAFGFQMQDGFAMDEAVEARLGDTFAAVIEPAVFKRPGGGLADHPITQGRSQAEKISHVMAFGGQSFRGPAEAQALFTLGSGWVTLFPERTWKFSSSTRRESAQGLFQGATLAFGAGRVAVVGEAAMLSAQTRPTDGLAMGMNHPKATQNAAFALNLMHWLAGELE
jgi:hypothetical protein